MHYKNDMSWITVAVVSYNKVILTIFNYFA